MLPGARIRAPGSWVPCPRQHRVVLPEAHPVSWRPPASSSGTQGPRFASGSPGYGSGPPGVVSGKPGVVGDTPAVVSGVRATGVMHSGTRPGHCVARPRRCDWSPTSRFVCPRRTQSSEARPGKATAPWRRRKALGSFPALELEAHASSLQIH
jgi:hypothetical protein